MERSGRHVVTGLAAGRMRRRRIVFPAGAQVRIAGVDLSVGQAFPAAIVEFSKPLVQLDGPAPRNRLRRLEGPEHRAGDDSVEPNPGQPICQRLGFPATRWQKRDVELPTEHGVAFGRLTVPAENQGEHGVSLLDGRRRGSSHLARRRPGSGAAAP